jgi:hypothetical protein
MKVQEAYKQKLAAQLHEWSAQIDLWEAKAENAGADMKVQQAEALRELRAKQHDAIDKLHEIEKASGEAWGQVKIAADRIWEDLKVGVAEAHSKFK